MKYEIRRELKIVPAKVSVVEHKKAVYVCKNCDKNGIEANFKTAKGFSATHLTERIHQRYFIPP